MKDKKVSWMLSYPFMGIEFATTDTLGCGALEFARDERHALFLVDLMSHSLNTVASAEEQCDNFEEVVKTLAEQNEAYHVVGHRSNLLLLECFAGPTVKNMMKVWHGPNFIICNK